MKLILVYFTILITFFCGNVFSFSYYCNGLLCWGVDHIACVNDGKFAPVCTNPVLLTFTQADKNLILHTHNIYRNRIAGGGALLAPACRMATMEWDNELALMASLNVKRCEALPDDCHSTMKYLHSGQNVAGVGYWGKGNVTDFIKKSIDLWYSEVKHTTIEHINNYPNGYNGPTIGHFTVMVADKNVRVGCAASTYIKAGQSHNSFLFTCNYATTNMINFPIYAACKKPATNCSNGTHPVYNNLCSTNEVYDVNKWMAHI